MSAFIERLKKGTKQFHDIDKEIKRLIEEIQSLRRQGISMASPDINKIQNEINLLRDLKKGSDKSNPCRDYKSKDKCVENSECIWSDVGDDNYITTWLGSPSKNIQGK